RVELGAHRSRDDCLRWPVGHGEVARAAGPRGEVLVPELRARDSAGAWCGRAAFFGGLQLVRKKASVGVRLVAVQPRVHAAVEEGAAGRPTAQVEVAVLPGAHLGPGATVPLVVGLVRR